MEKKFTKDVLIIKDIESVVNQICEKIHNDIFKVLRRRGAVIGISGGIDSSVSMALTVKAIGAENVIGIMLPEKDSSSDSERLAKILADKFKVYAFTENISDALKGYGCYTRRDEACTKIFPEYNPIDYKMKIVIKKSSMSTNLPPIFHLVIIDAQGNEKSKILPPTEYMQIVASSNFKQRSRMAMLYYHAERKHYVVIGTPNKHETSQGFFVKHGDGGADLMPIGNLFKTQVYQLAHYLGIPEEIIRRTPTTDTYSAEQTQEEFFFQLPFELMDLLWYAYENNCNVSEVANELKLTETEVLHTFENFKRRELTTQYLRMHPINDYKFI
jgi:NAD+ synthase